MLNLYGLIQASISGTIFLAPAFKRRESGEVVLEGLPKELILFETTPSKKDPVQHYSIGLSPTHAQQGLSDVEIQELFDTYVQQANFIDLGIHFESFDAKNKNPLMKIERIKSRLSILRGCVAFKKYCPDLIKQIEAYHEIIEILQPNLEQS